MTPPAQTAQPQFGLVYETLKIYNSIDSTLTRIEEILKPQ